MKKTSRNIFKSIIVAILATVLVIASTSNTTASGAASVDSVMLSKINSLRAQNGLAALTLDASLCAFAETRSVEAATKWSHTRPDGSQGADMIPHNKWRGENLSYVTYSGYTGSGAEQTSAADLMYTNLCNSPTHLDNMLFGQFTKIGIATSVVQTPSGTRLTTAYMFSN